MLSECVNGHTTAVSHAMDKCHVCKAVVVGLVALVLPATALAAKPNPIAHSGHHVQVHICPIAHSANEHRT